MIELVRLEPGSWGSAFKVVVRSSEAVVPDLPVHRGIPKSHSAGGPTVSVLAVCRQVADPLV